MPLEICDKFVSTMKSDGAIANYIGYSIDDPRIYSWNPMFNIVFSPTKKVAIFFRYIQNPVPDNSSSYPMQRGDISFYIQVQSPDKTLAASCAERIEDLFKDRVLETDNYLVKRIKCYGNSEGVIDGTVTRPIYSRVITLLFTNIFKTNEY